MNKRVKIIAVKNAIVLVTMMGALVALDQSTHSQPTNQPVSNGKGRYIDTHMHLHGSSKLIKDAGMQIQPDQPGPTGRRGPRGRGRVGYGPPGRRGPGGPQAQVGTEQNSQQIQPFATTPEDRLSAAGELVKLMDRYGVQKALIMPPPQNPGEGYDYRELAESIRAYPDRLVLVGGGGTLNPAIQGTKASEVTASVKKVFTDKANYIVRAGAKGFGEMTAMHLCMSKVHKYVATPADHPLFLELMDISAKNGGMPIDLHMEAIEKKQATPAGLLKSCDKNPKQIPATIGPLENLLEHNRKGVVVWTHIGWDNVGDMKPDLMRRLLKKHPNLYLAIRVEDRVNRVQGGPMPNRLVDGNWKLRPEWYGLFVEFPDRIMVGGDEFINPSAGGRKWPQSFEETWRLMDQLPSDVARKIGFTTAARVYGL